MSLFKSARKISDDSVKELLSIVKDENQLLHEIVTSINSSNKRNAADVDHASRRLEEIMILSGGKPEARIQDASSYEFALRIMKKQLEDQLIYIGGGDEKLISTIQFDSIEELCRVMLTTINITLDEGGK